MGFWSARELYPLLGYAKWERFKDVLTRAKESCENAGEFIAYHFADAGKMVKVGSGAQRQVDDVMLTRYACYLVAQNGDPRKPEIAFAQNYFAVQTRRAELVQQRLLDYERVQARAKLAETEHTLSGVLYERGVDAKGFAIVRTKGNRALFGLDAAMMKLHPKNVMNACSSWFDMLKFAVLPKFGILKFAVLPKFNYLCAINTRYYGYFSAA